MPPTDTPTVIPVRPSAAARVRWAVRVSLIAMGLGLATVFGIAVWLNPYEADGRPRSMATHTQLGMPACNFVAWAGKPCPSCGMTTSFALLVRGDVRASLAANWVGTLLAVCWAVLMPWALASGLAGRPLLVPRGRGEVITTGLVGGFLVLMLGRWLGVLLAG